MLQRLCNSVMRVEHAPASHPATVPTRCALRSRGPGRFLRIYYVLERDHHPYAHGPLEYSVAAGAFLNPLAGETLSRQAEAYVESYFRRKGSLR